jgi:hypothetical protein
MGQKSNIVTLRKSNRNFNFLNGRYDLTAFLSSFTAFFKCLLNTKDILVLDNVINFSNNQCFFNLSLYFCYSKLRFYTKKSFVKNNLNLFQFYKSPKILNLLNLTLSFLKSNLFIFKFINLNLLINTNILNTLYSEIKYSKNFLFLRKYPLFIDFLGITTLFTQGAVNSFAFLKVLGDIFRVLPKKQHAVFLSFLKNLFKSIIKISNNNANLDNSHIKGIKFILSGKIRGKLRGSIICIQEGRVPVQNISKNVGFERLHVFTLIGTFGMKL